MDFSSLRGRPILFHSIHSPSIHMSHDQRRAKRVSGCKGVCFSDRPIMVGEHIYIRIVEVSTSRNGALRFGFTSDDPDTVDVADLSRYASPDITNEQGYWAKALPEMMVQRGSILFFYISTEHTVIYGMDDKEIGVFFGGVQTDSPLWALMDLYGNTVSIEFIGMALVTGVETVYFNVQLLNLFYLPFSGCGNICDHICSLLLSSVELFFGNPVLVI